jgi:hypothetical protein
MLKYVWKYILRVQITVARLVFSLGCVIFTRLRVKLTLVSVESTLRVETNLVRVVIANLIFFNSLFNYPRERDLEREALNVAIKINELKIFPTREQNMLIN